MSISIKEMPQSIMKGLIDKSKVNATEISDKFRSSKRTKENFLSQSYECNLILLNEKYTIYRTRATKILVLKSPKNAWGNLPELEKESSKITT